MLVNLRAFIALCALLARVQAIPKVTRTGRYLYQEDGTRFYIKGIAYQPQGETHDSEDNDFGEPSTFIDPLADPAGCTRDAPILTEAGVNAIRVYSVNASLNHDECMKTFSDAGIYTILDVSTPLNGSIDRLAPSWSTNLLDHYLETIELFEKYDNVIAYNIGNEVVIADTPSVAPYVKAAARDTKAYLKSRGSSALVGYAAINGESGYRKSLADFLSCGSEETAIDLYGLNEYTWCGDSSFEGSGYSSAVTQFADYNVVAYFSEYGCVKERPRLWTEVDALFSSQMSDVWSGGIAFSYFPKDGVDGEYGLVTISADGSTVTQSAEFESLKTHYTAITPPNSPAQASVAASTYPTCVTGQNNLTASTTLPATPNDAACNCLEAALACRFTPPNPDYRETVGDLINYGCNQIGDGCAPIGGSGATGVYGRLSACDPVVKLSYVMTKFYESEGRNAAACDFAGNATLNRAASETDTADALASSCVANPDATFAPSAPATTRPASSGSPSGRPSGDEGSAIGMNALVGVASTAFMGALAAAWTLV